MRLLRLKLILASQIPFVFYSSFHEQRFLDVNKNNKMNKTHIGKSGNTAGKKKRKKRKCCLLPYGKVIRTCYVPHIMHAALNNNYII